MTTLNTDHSPAHQVDGTAPTSPVRATTFVGRWPTIPAIEMPGFPNGTFSPTTATLVTGPTEAVLIDALYLKDDVRDLGDLIERTGKRLTTIYITHAHQDHYLGFAPLLERFPDAVCVALPQVVDAIKQTMDLQTMQWTLMFGDTCVPAGPVPDVMEGHTLYVDGTPLEILEVKQADIHPTTIVHIPSIEVVVAGDSIYHEIHPMLGLSSPDEWTDWLETVSFVESLNPKRIITGHRRPDGDEYEVSAMIEQTRSYLRDFKAAFEISAEAEDIVRIMTAKYPNHANPWTLEFSAMNAVQGRETGHAGPHSVG